MIKNCIMKYLSPSLQSGSFNFNFVSMSVDSLYILIVLCQDGDRDMNFSKKCFVMNIMFCASCL